MYMRMGHGYDVHRFVDDRKLILGGVKIEHTKGLLGHSDADVLIHAIIDALFGAAGLGDIGTHFPDTDNRYKDISSLVLLKETRSILRQKGYLINNIDVTVVAEKPKIAPYIESMIINIATTLLISLDKINIKATTTEGLGFVGQEQGIAVYAVCSIIKKS